MERIVLERTTPVQGQVVTVKVSSASGNKGEFTLSFFEWLHFSKLLKAGMEYQKGRDEQRVEVVIVGKDQAVPPVVSPTTTTLPSVKKVLPKVEVSEDEVAAILSGDSPGMMPIDTIQTGMSQPRSLRGDDNASND